MKALLLAAALATAMLSAGCVEVGAGARSRVDAPEGDCWASQGPYGQSAGCDFGDGGCRAEQGAHGQYGGCRRNS